MRYIRITTVVLVLIMTVALSFLIGARYSDQSIGRQSKNRGGENLQIPALLEYVMDNGVKKFEINVEEGVYEFLDGVVSETYGYNGPILGPTIRFSEGDKVDIHVTNNLDEQTTTHWHGGVVPGEADGGVHNIIEPDGNWNARFDVIQQAATLWYHPHQHEETAEQVYKGLGGLIIIDDENSRSLNLPTEYGEDDIPIIIQSKNLTEDGELLPYQIGHHEVINGLEGNTVLINAQIQPKLEVSTNLVRLRVLNGSNSDVYNLAFTGDHEFYVIASDGGFYNEPILLDTLEIYPAKRFEILIDLTDSEGEVISMNVNGESQLNIEIDRELNDKYEVPDQLNKLARSEYRGEIDRSFDLELIGSMGMTGGLADESGYRGMPVYSINGQLFDMERVDFRVRNDSVEYWRVTNIDDNGHGLFHPFHVHSTQFEIIELNDEVPGKLLEGRHDTIALGRGDTAVIAVPFDRSLEGIYMYHCHILEHEDAGMMGQFELYSE